MGVSISQVTNNIVDSFSQLRSLRKCRVYRGNGQMVLTNPRHCTEPNVLYDRMNQIFTPATGKTRWCGGKSWAEVAVEAPKIDEMIGILLILIPGGGSPGNFPWKSGVKPPHLG